MAQKRATKLGRPPASRSEDTRDRILGVAQETFAELGFAITTNRFLAQKAGITTGALYHYFDSKLALYEAVYVHVQERVYGRFAAVVKSADTFVGQFEAVLEAAHELNREDPSLARFVGAARVDMARNDQLRVLLTPDMQERVAFVVRMVDTGVATGEIDEPHRAAMLVFVRMLFVGLTDAVSADARQHRMAIDSIRAAVEGRLLRPPRNR